MAEKDRPPATDLLINNAQQVASDRARRINSLHKQVDGLIQNETKKTRQTSGEVSSILQQQQNLRKELSLERDEMSADVAKGYGKVVNSLGDTIKQLSIGMKNISVSTAQASADAISQYGKAIGQDININKTNTIAMSLAKATPLFGYFAAKFMETDVFRGAISKIRQGVGGAMLAGLRGAGSSISNIFRGKSTGEKIAGRERELGALSSEVAGLKKELQAKPPQMQSGGYVKKGGVVEVHAAEIVAPVDSLVKQIVQSTSAEQEKRTKTMMRTFIKEFKSGGGRQEQAWQDRMLKAILELKVAFIGTTSRLRIAWQKTLLENPAFRGMLMFAEGFKAVLGAPITWLFGARGMYLSDVKKATSTDNVFLKISNILGLIYTVMMPKLDAIASYTRISAREASGTEPKEPIPTRYSMYQKIKGFIARKKAGEKGDLKGFASDKLLSYLGLESKEERAEFKKEGGIQGIFRLAKEVAEVYGEDVKKGKDAIKSKVESAKTSAEDKMFDLQFKARGLKKQYKHAGAGSVADTILSKISKTLSEQLKLKKEQNDREKPSSPSWVQYLGMLFGKAKESTKHTVKQTKTAAESYVESKKTRKASESQLSFLGKMAKRLRKLGGIGWKLMMFAFTMFQNAINLGVTMIGTILSPLLSALGIRGLFKKGGKGFIKTAGEGISKGAKGAGKFAGKTARVQRMAGGKAAAKFAGKGVAKAGAGLAGRLAVGAGKVALGVGGSVVGGVIGAGFGIWDAIQAIRDPEGFAGGAITRAFSAFLGGRESGTSGAISGAMKLGGIGAGIGILGGPIGVAIGGAIGAVAGGILGFIGGKNLSKAASWFGSKVKKFAGAIYNVVMFMPRLIKESIKLLWGLLTKTEMGKKVMDIVKNAAKQAWKTITMPYTIFFRLLRKLGSLIGDQWEKFKGTGIGQGIIDAWDSFTQPIKDLWGMLKAFGSSVADMWNGTIGYINDVIKKIQDIPFIGKFVKGIKEITAGTFAENVVKKVQIREHYGKVAPASAGGVLRPFEMQKGTREQAMKSVQYAREILGAEEIRFQNGIAHLAKIGGKWYKIKIDNSGLPKELSGKWKTAAGVPGEDDGPIKIAVRSEAYRRKANAEELDKVADAIVDKMDETSDEANKIAIGNTNILTNNMNHTNTSNSSSGGGSPGGATGSWWGSGNVAANDVTYSAMN